MKKNVIKYFFIGVVIYSILLSGITVYGKADVSKLSWDNLSDEEKNSIIYEIVEETNEFEKKECSYEEEKKFLDSATNINAMADRSIEEIEEYFSNVYSGVDAANMSSGGEITNPIIYLHNNVGKASDTYTIVKDVSYNIEKSSCGDLDKGNNCTLTALCNIMFYYRNCRYYKIPESKAERYSIIKKQAIPLGYTGENGLTFTKNNNLVKNTWRDGFGYSTGNGKTNYLWNSDTLTKALDNGKPFLFSLASGYYYNHTVAVYGYRVYKNNRTGVRYTFLLLADGWHNSGRYLAWENTKEAYVGCMTAITTPTYTYK